MTFPSIGLDSREKVIPLFDPILVLELFTLVPSLFGTTSHCLSVQPVQLLPSRNI